MVQTTNRRNTEVDKLNQLESMIKQLASASGVSLTETPEQAPTSTQLGGHEIMLTDYGKQIADEMVAMYPDPIFLRGGAGLGKSVLAKYIASQVSSTPLTAINADQGMKIDPVIGMWNPKPVATTCDVEDCPCVGSSGTTIEWVDGSLTTAIKNGTVFLMEEITRMPETLASKLFGLLDTDNRSWVLIEKSGESVPVHRDFWFLATGNPSGGGYTTKKLDTAMASRFAAVYDINEPLAPESAILANYVDVDLAESFVRFASDCRENSLTYVSTRELTMAARHVQRGIAPTRAVELAISPKYDAKIRDGITQLAQTHLQQPEPQAQPEPEQAQPDVTPLIETITAAAAAAAKTTPPRVVKTTSKKTTGKASGSGRKNRKENGCIRHWGFSPEATVIADLLTKCGLPHGVTGANATLNTVGEIENAIRACIVNSHVGFQDMAAADAYVDEIIKLQNTHLNNLDAYNLKQSGVGNFMEWACNCRVCIAVRGTRSDAREIVCNLPCGSRAASGKGKPRHGICG